MQKADDDGLSRADGIKVPNLEDHRVLRRRTREAIMKLTPVGIDIAKNVFQVHCVDERSGEIVNKPIKRAKFLEYFANRSPCLNEMNASHP